MSALLCTPPRLDDSLQAQLTFGTVGGLQQLVLSEAREQLSLLAAQYESMPVQAKPGDNKKKHKKKKKAAGKLPAQAFRQHESQLSPARSGTDESQAETGGYASGDTLVYDEEHDNHDQAGKGYVECAVCLLPWNKNWYCVSGCLHAIYCNKCAIVANRNLRTCPYCQQDTTRFPTHCMPCAEATGVLIYIESE